MTKIKELLTLHPDVKRIFITGHSLGGAYTNLLSMGMAQEKKKNGLFSNQSLHAITFGAPFTFLKMSRDVYNGLLADGYLTLDRVITSSRFKDPTFSTTDVIPNLPPNFFHPGFTIGWREIKTQSRTGRTKHSRELREQFFNITRTKSLFGTSKILNYNSLPTYDEFLSKFLDKTIDSSITSKEYKSLINSTYAGTIRSEKDHLANKIRAIVTKLLAMTPDEFKSLESQVETETKQTLVVANELAGEKAPETFQAGVESIQTEAAQQRKEIEAAYAAAGQPLPAENQEGGALVLDTNQENKQYQPNTVVYSCYQNIGMLAPIPILHFFTCHLNYMGVSWLGCVKQILVEIKQQSKAKFAANEFARQFEKEASIYREGIYTMKIDKAPAPSVETSPLVPKTGGTRTNRRNKRRGTRRI